jgi:dTDP-4-dehydrorhamnose reductase
MIPMGRGTQPSVDAREPFDGAVLDAASPDLVINAVAVSSAAACARDPRTACLVNAAWPRSLARECARRGIPLVHVSSDLVYSGGIPPYGERSPCVPGSIYGWTKLLGDRAVMREHPGALVARTSVLFGEAGAALPTFSEELLAGAVKTVHVDSYRNHTPIRWFAAALLEAWRRNLRGLVIIAGRDSLARSAFAEMLLEHVGMASRPPLGYRPPGTPPDLSLETALCSRLLGQTPDPFQSFEIEYPRDQASASSSARNLPV